MDEGEKTGTSLRDQARKGDPGPSGFDPSCEAEQGDDLAAWLRLVGDLVKDHSDMPMNGYYKAADELTSLRSRNAELEEALREGNPESLKGQSPGTLPGDGCVPGVREGAE